MKGEEENIKEKLQEWRNKGGLARKAQNPDYRALSKLGNKKRWDEYRKRKKEQEDDTKRH